MTEASYICVVIRLGSGLYLVFFTPSRLTFSLTFIPLTFLFDKDKCAEHEPRKYKGCRLKKARLTHFSCIYTKSE